MVCTGRDSGFALARPVQGQELVRRRSRASAAVPPRWGARRGRPAEGRPEKVLRGPIGAGITRCGADRASTQGGAGTHGPGREKQGSFSRSLQGRIHGGPEREFRLPLAYSVVRARLLDGRAALSGARIGRMGRTGRMGDSKRGEGRAAKGGASPRRAAPRRAAQGRPVLADPFYYLNNFKSVLSSLEERYWDLLSAEELQFIAQFADLPRASCALLVRMIMRRGAFFRLSRLRYPEIGNAAEAAAPLFEVGWLQEPVLDVSQLRRLLTKGELIGHLGPPRPLGKLQKAALLDVLCAQYSQSRPFQAWCENSQDRVFHPLVKPIAERFRLMFFGNFHQDWTEFVLADLGINSYEKIPLQSAPFRTRAHFEAFLELYRCQRSLEEGAELDQVVAAIPSPIADSDWLEDIRQRLLFQIAAAYERSGNTSSAMAILSTCRHRGARARAIRLLERLGQWQAARDLCLVARENPESESELQQLQRVLPRLHRKLGVTAEKRLEPPAVATFEVLFDAPQSSRPVEICVGDFLAQQEGPHSTVHYVENGLINSVFGLLFWDAIFAPIPGAFFHDFQYGPADLESGRFYERRKSQFAEGLGELESGEYKSTIRRRFLAKAGIQAPFVAWGLLTERLLELALRCFPAPHLRLWFEWIVRDIVDNRAGFPDLVQFWPSEPRYRMVEVKGPGDRLQDNQRRFLEFCAGHRMPVFVCQVRGHEAARLELEMSRLKQVSEGG
jgi:hypothetical protein